MRLTVAFIAHELRTQFRSGRFRLLATAYVLLASLPSVAFYFRARRAAYLVGPASFTYLLTMTQPVMTTIFAALIAIDAITRERDESSFAVVSLAPMTNSGYLLRRWLAVSLVALATTTIPRAVGAALCYAVTHAVPASMAWMWLLRVVPVVFLATAITMAFGTIAGRTFFAALAMLAVFTVGMQLVNDVLARSHRHIEAILSPLWIEPGEVRLLETSIGGWAFPGVPSAAGPFPSLELQEAMAKMPIVAGIAALLLGVTPAFLRRSRRAVRPWPIRPDHPLRSFIAVGNRIREAYTPDAGIEWSDLAFATLGIALFIGGCTVRYMREWRYQTMAARQFAGQTSRLPLPTPRSVVPVSIAIDGSLGERVKTRVTMRLRNNGSLPVSHLAFIVNPMLDVRIANARTTRIWDRLGVDVDPPIAPHAEAALTFDLDGDAATPLYRFGLRQDFITQYRRFIRAKDSSELTDFGRSTMEPLATPWRMMLSIGDIALVPRYTPFEVITDGANEPAVRFEEFLPRAEIVLSLRVPDGLFVADSCGSMAHDGRLESRCESAIDSYTVFAAPLRTMSAGRVTVAYIPAHAEVARVHGEAFDRALTLAERSWPGLSLPSAATLVELPTERFQVGGYGDFEFGWFTDRDRSRAVFARGALTIFPERLFVRKRAIDPSFMASSIVTNRILQKRELAPEEEWFFREFFDAVARSRMAGEGSNAVAPPTPLPRTDPMVGSAASFDGAKMYYTLTDLEARVGSDRLIEGINDFLSASKAPGNAEELFRAIGRRGGVSLDRFYSDYVTGSSLPRLTLAGVTFRRDGDQWITSGTLRNLGTGQAVCPIVLRTAFASSQQTIVIDSHQDVAFTMKTNAEPRVLQMDPEKICYRYGYIGSVDSVEHRSDS